VIQLSCLSRDHLYIRSIPLSINRHRSRARTSIPVLVPRPLLFPLLLPLDSRQQPRAGLGTRALSPAPAPFLDRVPDDEIDQADDEDDDENAQLAFPVSDKGDV
jgi:hypothetical protein